jgi:hypothetical protein
VVVREYVFLVYTEIVAMVVDYALVFVEQGHCWMCLQGPNVNIKGKTTCANEIIGGEWKKERNIKVSELAK